MLGSSLLTLLLQGRTEGNGAVGVQGRNERLEKPCSPFLQGTAAQGEVLNTEQTRMDGRLQVNQQGWKEFAWSPIMMHFKITIYGVLLSNRELALLSRHTPTTGFFKAFLGA